MTQANWKYSNHLFEEETAVLLTTATNTKALLGIIKLIKLLKGKARTNM